MFKTDFNEKIMPAKQKPQFLTIRVALFSMVLFISCSNQKEGTATSTDSAPVYYKTFGKGKPLLIINGGPGMNSQGFENLAIRLSQNNRTIIYDQRGTGKSVLKRLDTSTVTMQLMMDDIESLRKELNIEKWSILGHSFGGMLASQYATLYPERIEKLILSSSGGIDLNLLTYVNQAISSKLTQTQLDSVDYWTKKMDEGDTSHYARLGRGRNLASAYVWNKNYLPVIAERLTQGNGTINQLIWRDLQKTDFNCAAKLKTFKQPVLIIQGKDDIIKAETAERAHTAFSNSKVILVDHCIHYGWLDNEEVYFKEVNSFLAAN
jgi:proline iminopeptidase